MQSLTRSCISKVTETGLNVVALVCDQGSNKRSFIQHLEKVTIDRPYLMYENRKIFVFYDPPHLLKNVRNNLKKADLRIDEGVVNWQHIVDFYNFDKCQPIQMAPKLERQTYRVSTFFSNVSEFSCTSIKSLCCSRNISFSNPEASA